MIWLTVDRVYDERIQATSPNSVGKPARTLEEKQLWSEVFDLAISEIYQDEVAKPTGSRARRFASCYSSGSLKGETKPIAKRVFIKSLSPCGRG